MRAGRNLSQGELAERAGMKQSRISLMENPSYEGLNINTLRRLAAAFDVALIVRFVPYGELLGWATNLDEKQLNPVSFDHDPAFKPMPMQEIKGSAVSAIQVVQQPSKQGAIKGFERASDWAPEPRIGMPPQSRQSTALLEATKTIRLQ
jgi:transcriptional regulator with XRE-family HTH domain